MDDKILTDRVFQDPRYFIAFGFGSGLLPKAPGTWGTLLSLLLYWVLPDQTFLSFGLLIVIAFGIGVWVSERVTRDLGIEDYAGIVWDEVVGYWVTMWALPKQWSLMLAGFILFRFFDIVKPEPIRTIDKRMKGGLGIMLDDVLAGIAACLILHIMVWGRLL